MSKQIQIDRQEAEDGETERQ